MAIRAAMRIVLLTSAWEWCHGILQGDCMESGGLGMLQQSAKARTRGGIEASEGDSHKITRTQQAQAMQGMHQVTRENTQGHKGTVVHSAQTNTSGQGILLWSEGRSASDSLMKTLQRTTGLEFCNGHEESFKGGNNPVNVTLSFESLQRCIQKGELLMHVKPSHLTTKTSMLRTPEAFFDAAFRAGFKLAIANFRENQLARDVSSFEQDLKRHENNTEEYALQQLHCESPIEHYEEDRRVYSAGFQAATKAGFTVAPLSFSDISASTCTCVLKIMVLYNGSTNLNCTPVVTHREKSHREASLEERTTKKAASCIRSALSNTSYSWMLDLTADDWPSEIVPPLPVPTWHQHM
eukprot:TRINITY_DN2692_c0_g1_i2.p1 TRINITY_DN2692_c0_g1~~TRINITY_DN2692_c0_g1_i2.p1  ORF type:complete len:352 (+),score=48.45 TRINITY_DN2692_c0_g1_i2:74-1129(+)